MANSPKGLEQLVTQAPENDSNPCADTLQPEKHTAQAPENDSDPCADTLQPEKRTAQAPENDSNPCADTLQPEKHTECPCKCFFWRRSQRNLAAVTPILPTESGSYGAEAGGSEVHFPVSNEDNTAAQTVSRSSSPMLPVAAPVEDPEPLVLPWMPPTPKEKEEQEAVMFGQLAPQTGHNVGRKTLVLDLDETLVHSSFRVVHTADIVISVELEGEHHRVFVRKRPGVDEFLWKVAQAFEVVVYTASMAKYANPLLDELDRDSVVTFRLFREACTKQANGYVKDLSKLGRNLKDVIIIDNSPTCYSFQPHNAIPIKTWREDPQDHELLDLVPILYSLKDVEDIPQVLTQLVWGHED